MSAKKFRSAILFVILSLAACSPKASPTAAPVLPLTATQPSPTSLRTALPTRLSTPAFTATAAEPHIAPADEILETSSIYSMPLSALTGLDNPGVQLALDDQYIYMAGDQRLLSLYRFPLAGGALERIVSSRYIGGRLNLFQPILSGNWIVFADMPATLQGISGRWMVRAVNLKNHSEWVVARSENDPLDGFTAYSFAGEAGKLYWTRTIYAAEDKIDRTTVSRMDLDSGSITLLSRTSYAGWTWSMVQVSNGQLVLQQDQENHHSEVFLFDPDNGQLQALSKDGISNRPLFEYPWVVWEVTPATQDLNKPEASQLHLYNLETLESRTISLPGTDASDPRLSGSFVYWAGTTDQIAPTHSANAAPYLNAFYLFDLNKNVIYEYPAAETGVIFTDLVLRGKTMAWIREDINGTGKGYLEWTTLK